MDQFFTVHHRSKRSKARVGEIQTKHGLIKTPAFVPVATKGTIKSIAPEYFKEIGMQVAFVNAYHLVNHPGVEVIKKAGGIRNLAHLDIPLMSDSAGFQVFSLAAKQKLRRAGMRDGEGDEALVQKITEDGVIFKSLYDGSILEFTPEKSIEYQQIIGADMIMAFDECTDYASSHTYTKKAMERTHEWLQRCIVMHKKNKTNQQFLYGIIQGGAFEDLRQASAEFIASQDTEGVAIGSVANGGETKRQVREQLSFVAKFLPDNKPVHLLGIGQIDDILDTIQYGIDTFDCVEPTRVARMGGIYQMKRILQVAEKLADGQTISSGFYKEDILKGKYRGDLSKLDEDCSCNICQKYTKAFIHHLIIQRELLGYTLASYHNLYVMEKFMDYVREKINRNEI